MSAQSTSLVPQGFLERKTCSLEHTDSASQRPDMRGRPKDFDWFCKAGFFSQFSVAVSGLAKRLKSLDPMWPCVCENNVPTLSFGHGPSHVAKCRLNVAPLRPIETVRL